MRLKEDSSNYNAESVKRKEFRHSPVSYEVVKRKSKKDTKRWCKGVIGVEHEWEKITPRNVYKGMRLNVCRKCGKQDATTMEFLCRDCGEWFGGKFWKHNCTKSI